jgi:hypothetical protein
MKRAGALGAAILLTLGLALTAGADVKYKRIKTEVQFLEIEVNGDETTFSGKLESRKHKCVKKRRGLYVKEVGDVGVVGNDRTDRKGNWEFTRPTAGLDDAEYEATIRSLLVRKDGERRFKCKGGRGTLVADLP